MGSPHSYTAKELAAKFHEAYERLAQEHGYVTRRDTRQFDPESPNGRLMIAVCEEIRGSLLPEKYVEIGSLYRGRYSAIQFLQSAQSIPQLGAHGSLPVYMKVTGDDATNSPVREG